MRWRCTRCLRLKEDIFINGCDQMVRGWDFDADQPIMEPCSTAPLEPVPEGQSRIDSIMEAVTNTAIGFSIARQYILRRVFNGRCGG